MTDHSKQRRSIQERVEAIFKFIKAQEGVFPKSRLKEIGLNPKAAEKWLSLIEFIQEQPRIRLVQSEHNTLIEKVEGGYEALMRKRIIDESIPIEKRTQSLIDYLSAIGIRERIGVDRVQKKH